MRAIMDDLFRAFSLLTRLPMPQVPDGDDGYARCVWAFPLVGAVIGALSALLWFGGQFAGLGLSLSAGLVVAFQLLLTGAMHEDGIADFADGLGGGNDPERRLAIMRDSRIGTYGVVALIVIVGLRWSAIASLGLHMVLAGLICSALIGRLVMAVLPGILETAREEGLGTLVARPSRKALFVALLISAVVLFLHLPSMVAMVSIIAAILSVCWIAMLAKRSIGGYTGDVLGAAGLTAETAALLVFASV